MMYLTIYDILYQKEIGDYQQETYKERKGKSLIF